MLTRTYFKDSQDAEPGIVTLRAVLPTTTSGAIDTTSALYRVSNGLTVVKTATENGRYTLTCDGAFVRLHAAGGIVETTADTAYTAGKGVIPVLRGVSASTGVVYIQFITIALADAEVEDAATLRLWIAVQVSAARG